MKITLMCRAGQTLRVVSVITPDTPVCGWPVRVG